MQQQRAIPNVIAKAPATTAKGAKTVALIIDFEIVSLFPEVKEACIAAWSEDE